MGIILTNRIFSPEFITSCAYVNFNSGHLAECVVFNSTISRGPRNVARCTTCSCSKSGGLTGCEPVTCKLPYKFSDKCRAIYRSDDCCPIDYDCPGSFSTKGILKSSERKPATSFHSVTAKAAQNNPTHPHHPWSAEQKQSGSAAATSAQSTSDGGNQQQYDLSESPSSEPPVRSDPSDAVTEKIAPTVKPTKEKVSLVEQKSIRFIEVPAGVSGVSLRGETVPGKNVESQVDFISIKTGSGKDAQIDIRVHNISATPEPEKITTNHDPLLRVFLKVAEKANKTLTNFSSPFSATSNFNQDVMTYDTPVFATRFPKDAPKTSGIKSPENSPGVWQPLKLTQVVESLPQSTTATRPEKIERTTGSTTSTEMDYSKDGDNIDAYPGGPIITTSTPVLSSSIITTRQVYFSSDYAVSPYKKM